MAILLKMGRNVVSRALAGGSAAAAHPTPLAARHPSFGLGVSFFSDGLSPPPRPGGLFREVDGFVGGGFGLGFNLGFVRFNRIPRKTKFAKQFKGTMKGIAHRGNELCFGTYALQALEPAWITSQQIEAGRRAMSRVAGRGSKIWIRVIPDKPITRKPAETRMGRGKGSVAFWVAVVQPGRILYEMGGVTESVAKKAITIAASKMPIGTRIKKC